jgi:heme exporter protein B
MANNQNESTLKTSSVSQFSTLFKLGIRSELKNKEKMVSPFILGAIILVMFSFATGEIDKSFKIQFFTAELLLTILFSLSIYFIRAFETEYEDGIFNQLRSLSISRVAWFMSKFTLVSLLSSLSAGLVLFVASGFISLDNDILLPNLAQLVLIVFLAIIGLSALGVLLSAITLKAKGRSIVFPLLYYPLTVPVLLAATQSINLLLIKNTPVFDSQWGMILAGFDCIYIILSILLFEELVD